MMCVQTRKVSDLQNPHQIYSQLRSLPLEVAHIVLLSDTDVEKYGSLPLS